MTPTKLDWLLFMTTMLFIISGIITALYLYHLANVGYHNPMAMTAIWIISFIVILFECVLGLWLWGDLFGSDSIGAPDGKTK